MKVGLYWVHMVGFGSTLLREVRLCNDGAVPIQRLAAITIPVLALAGDSSPEFMRVVVVEIVVEEIEE